MFKKMLQIKSVKKRELHLELLYSPYHFKSFYKEDKYCKHFVENQKK